jgi:hypothetical protein
MARLRSKFETIYNKLFEARTIQLVKERIIERITT